uniref:TYRO protein tyrosine kinase-binding protein n=1 Tax=Chelonoidis abingdonii TaxID=106734 RepID=A0A8C0JFE7_CHEAB
GGGAEDCSEIHGLMPISFSPPCPDCTGCPQLSGGLIAGLVVGDLLLTLLIAMAVYCLAGKIHRHRGSAQGTALGSELQGQRLDIYSDLKKSGANY